jgi:uncharacterized protein (DUF952 family)
MMIYKILRPAEWDELQANGISPGAPVDVADGYVHFSTATQVRETAARHFAGEGDLVLAAVDSASLGDALCWEASRGGARFPHLYRELRLSDVAWTAALPRAPDGHLFPDDTP